MRSVPTELGGCEAPCGRRAGHAHVRIAQEGARVQVETKIFVCLSERCLSHKLLVLSRPCRAVPCRAVPCRAVPIRLRLGTCAVTAEIGFLVRFSKLHKLHVLGITPKVCTCRSAPALGFEVDKAPAESRPSMIPTNEGACAGDSDTAALGPSRSISAGASSVGRAESVTVRSAESRDE